MLSRYHLAVGIESVLIFFHVWAVEDYRGI